MEHVNGLIVEHVNPNWALWRLIRRSWSLDYLGNVIRCCGVGGSGSPPAPKAERPELGLLRGISSDFNISVFDLGRKLTGAPPRFASRSGAVSTPFISPRDTAPLFLLNFSGDFPSDLGDFCGGGDIFAGVE